MFLYTGDSDLHGGFELGGVVLSGALHQTQHHSLQRAGQRRLQGSDQILKRFRGTQTINEMSETNKALETII